MQIFFKQIMLFTIFSCTLHGMNYTLFGDSIDICKDFRNNINTFKLSNKQNTDFEFLNNKKENKQEIIIPSNKKTNKILTKFFMNLDLRVPSKELKDFIQNNKEELLQIIDKEKINVYSKLLKPCLNKNIDCSYILTKYSKNIIEKMSILYLEGFTIVQSKEETNQFLEFLKIILQEYHKKQKVFLFIKFEEMRNLLRDILELKPIKTHEECLKANKNNHFIVDYIRFCILPIGQETVDSLTTQSIKMLLSCNYITAEMMATWFMKSSSPYSVYYLNLLFNLGVKYSTYDNRTGQNLFMIVLSSLLNNPEKYKGKCIITKLKFLMEKGFIDKKHTDNYGKTTCNYLAEVIESKDIRDTDLKNYCSSLNRIVFQ